jgi:hypothetical protein
MKAITLSRQDKPQGARDDYEKLTHSELENVSELTNTTEVSVLHVSSLPRGHDKLRNILANVREWVLKQIFIDPESVQKSETQDQVHDVE